jgi:hypothetical protein
VGNRYLRLNFGVVRVDWDRQEVVLEARGNDGNLPIQQKIALADLRRKA